MKRKVLGKVRIALLNKYVENYGSLSDEKMDELVKNMQTQRKAVSKGQPFTFLPDQTFFLNIIEFFSYFCIASLTIAMSGKKHISFILLFCFTILLGHSLVPHHHHAEILPKAINADCPIEHKDHNDSVDDPLHCHAFNNVAIFKDSPSHLQQRVREISTMIIPLTQCVTEPPAAFGSFRYISFTIPDGSFNYCGAISPRAPPASA